MAMIMFSKGLLPPGFFIFQSLAVHEDPSSGGGTNHSLVAACSVNNIACQTSGPSQEDKSGRVASWAVHFDKLLKDPVGLNIFTNFLKMEFSEENILFWTACEQFRQLTLDDERKVMAKDIYNRFMSPKASDPVNVDSSSRLYTEKFLDNPVTIMFDVAQQHIFHLMRQDSYARFLKSDIYKNKLMEEMEGKPLEVEDKEENQQLPKDKEKKKGKGKENEDKRRRSLLPWKQGKKSSVKSSEIEGKRASKKVKDNKDKEKDHDSGNSNSVNLNVAVSNSVGTNTLPTHNAHTHHQLKKAPGPGIDLSTMRKEVFHPRDVHDTAESDFKFCRIVMPDGSTTVVCAKPGQTSRTVLGKLCEKRNISINSVDVFLLGADKPLNLDEDVSTLGSKEIVIERRVIFRLDLPNGKSVGVKAKPNRSIRDVFKPIINKYGYRMDTVSVHLADSLDFFSLDQQVSDLDNKRAIVLCDTIDNDNNGETPHQGPQPLSARAPRAPIGGRYKGNLSGSAGGSLEEITNKIFEDLMRGKSQVAHGFDELGVLELNKVKENKDAEVHSSGLFGLLRKESWGAKENQKNKNKGKVTFALPRTESKKKSNVKEGEHLFELLSSAQSLRMEEQRGVAVSTGDMPSFLVNNSDKEKEKNTAIEEVHLKSSDSLQPSMRDVLEDNSHLSKARHSEKQGVRRNIAVQPVTPRLSASTPRDFNKLCATPASEKWRANGDVNVNQDKTVSTPWEADGHFRMSPVVIDSSNRSKVSQSLDWSALQAVDDMSPPFSDAVEPDWSGHKLNPGFASQFVAPGAFRPLHTTFSRAPVASPEKFSPQNKKPRNSPDIKTSVSSILPNKISPETRCSSSSSNMSSGNAREESPVTHMSSVPASKSGGSVQKGTHRLSDSTLMHKLQQTQEERGGGSAFLGAQKNDLKKKHCGTSTAGYVGSDFPVYSLGSPSMSSNSTLTTMGPAPSANVPSLSSRQTKSSSPSPQLVSSQSVSNGSHYTSHSFSTFTTNSVDFQDLSQRALLSPRQETVSPGRDRPVNRTFQPRSAQQMTQSVDLEHRALLSPRFQDSLDYRGNSPGTFRTSINVSVSATSDSHSTLVSPRYNRSQTKTPSPPVFPPRHVTAPPPPYTSRSSSAGVRGQVSLQSAGTPRYGWPQPEHHTSAVIPTYAVPYKTDGEETVTFV